MILEFEIKQEEECHEWSLLKAFSQLQVLETELRIENMASGICVGGAGGSLCTTLKPMAFCQGPILS